MQRLHNHYIKIHKCKMAPEMFTWMHASCLIGFMLKREFNNVRRGKCKEIKKKQYLSLNCFCLFSSKGLEGRNNCLVRPESWSWCFYLCLHYFFDLIWTMFSHYFIKCSHSLLIIYAHRWCIQLAHFIKKSYTSLWVHRPARPKNAHNHLLV